MSEKKDDGMVAAMGRALYGEEAWKQMTRGSAARRVGDRVGVLVQVVVLLCLAALMVAGTAWLVVRIVGAL